MYITFDILENYIPISLSYILHAAAISSPQVKRFPKECLQA